MTRAEAVAAMEANELEGLRVAMPEEWVVWREGDMVFSKDLP